MRRTRTHYSLLADYTMYMQYKIQKTRRPYINSATDRRGYVGTQVYQFSEITQYDHCSRSFKVADFGTSRKLISYTTFY